ncbi:MAG: formimidoylglutamase [Balneola sp.]|nr:MAG: formimidoylglutamase [Balneola sp.]
MSASNIDLNYYQAPQKDVWIGRTDSDTDSDQFRYHQVAKPVHLDRISESKEVALLGFTSDQGVVRNKGRIGASKGPDSFRSAIGSLCWHGEQSGFIDVGNILPKSGNLEVAQAELGKGVAHLLRNSKKSFVIGGGHETAFGHYLGIADYLSSSKPDAKLGILNIDAHFDLRPYDGTPHSGSPFLQAHEHAQKENMDLRYFVYGLNRHNNTASLFKTVESLGVQWIENQEVMSEEEASLEKVAAFIEERDYIYLTVCLDVFNAAIAPGVSAPAWNGIFAEHAIKVIELVKNSGKLLSMDVCELNPEFDQDNRTAKLAGTLFAEFLD